MRMQMKVTVEKHVRIIDGSLQSREDKAERICCSNRNCDSLSTIVASCNAGRTGWFGVSSAKISRWDKRIELAGHSVWVVARDSAAVGSKYDFGWNW